MSMTEIQSERMQITSDMMELFRRFAVTAIVNQPNGSIEQASYWTNKTAEARFNELKRRLERLDSQEGNS